MPSVSVVMSVYNGRRYLRQAIDSILAQTFDDFEFLIVNDASTDNTAQILASCDDCRIVVLENQRNLGLAASLNRALEASRGKYIARQDADDVSDPERFSKQVFHLDAYPEVGIVGTTTEWISDTNDVLRVWRQPTSNAAIQETLLRYCCLVHGSTMYRRQCFEEVGGYDPEMRTGQDYDLWLRMAETWDVSSLPEVLYAYRWHHDMASARREEEQKRNAEMALDRAIRRRLCYGRLALRLRSGHLPLRLRQMSRQRLAERYVWWSAGARGISRTVALRFLLIALLLDPATPEIWQYIQGIVRRKVGMNRDESSRGLD